MLTEKTYCSTLRIELDEDGSVLKLEVHNRNAIAKNGVTIHWQDTKTDVDPKTFKKMCLDALKNVP